MLFVLYLLRGLQILDHKPQDYNSKHELSTHVVTCTDLFSANPQFTRPVSLTCCCQNLCSFSVSLHIILTCDGCIFDSQKAEKTPNNIKKQTDCFSDDLGDSSGRHHRHSGPAPSHRH